MPTKTAKGLSLACPFCGAADEITLDLNDLRSVTCTSSSETKTAQEIYTKAAEVAGRWASTVAWIEAAPVE